MIAALAVSTTPGLRAQNVTAVTYQGALRDPAAPANGLFDFRFALYDQPAGGTGPRTEYVTNSAVLVSNGLFTARFDFGAQVFSSTAPLFLEVAVRPNGLAGPFEVLSPRQPLTAAPYANFAPHAQSAVTAETATTVVGPVSDGLLSSNVALRAGGNAFTGSQTVNAGRLGIGTITPLMPLHVAGGGGPASLLVGERHDTGGYTALFQGVNAVSGGFAYLQAVRSAGSGYGDVVLNPNGGNVGIGIPAPNHKLHVIGDARFERNDGRLFLQTPTRNEAGRFGIQFGNNLLAPFLGDDTQEQTFGFYSAFSSRRTNDARLQVHGRATNDWNAYVELTHDGGAGRLGTDAAALELRPGQQRALRLEPRTNGAPNVIAGSSTNSVDAGVVAATISGGGAALYGTGFSGGTGGAIPMPYVNRVSADFGTVGGGGENAIEAGSAAATLGGGLFNRIGPTSVVATVSGGGYNLIGSNALGAVIAGGLNHSVGAGAALATIGGGSNNVIEPGSALATIGGGYVQGIGERAPYATIAGGVGNWIQSNSMAAAIVGGSANEIGRNAGGAVISGGAANLVRTDAAYGTVPGGFRNEVGGTYGLAAGQRAKALHAGSFVWADAQGADFTSTAANQFLVRAAGGVGINKANPAATLDVAGSIAATSFAGAGAGLTGLSASSLTSGTLPDARLSANVALRNGGNTFTGIQVLDQNDGRWLLRTPARNDPGRSGVQFANNTLGLFLGDDTQEQTFGFYSAFSNRRTNDARIRVHGRTANNWNGYVELTHDGTDARVATDLGALRFSLSNETVLRLVPTTNAPNVIAGWMGNGTGPDVFGATIAGGGSPDLSGRAASNRVEAYLGTIGGGAGNVTEGMLATVAGGYLNTIGYRASEATISGGVLNRVGQDAFSAVIAGGTRNTNNARFGTISGGYENTLLTNALDAAIGGGYSNLITTGTSAAVIGGGRQNRVQQGADSASIGGGRLNVAGDYTVAATIAGGHRNQVTGAAATGGAVGGGAENLVLSSYATIPGGYQNAVQGNYSMAAGRRAVALHPGVFVWADSTGSEFASTGADQFIIRASGGVGINKNDPDAALDVEGDVKAGMVEVSGPVYATSYHGSGASLSNLPNGRALDAADGSPANAVYVDGAGRVGVGTTAPAASLDVDVSTADASLRLRAGGISWPVVLNQNAGSSLFTLSNGFGVIAMQSAGNVGIGTNAPSQKLVVSGNILATGTITPNSDRNAKTGFAAVDPVDVLDRLVQLPIQQWRFKSEEADVTHLGPMAQDFQAAFGLGELPTAIATVDADGVALAAIQGLHRKLEDEVRQKNAEIAQLRRELEELKQLMRVRADPAERPPP